MNWIPAFREPWAWALLAAVPVVIVLMYFLKLRRVPVEIPSTYLWAKTIEDLHVNSLLQRLRRNLLLFLQLLAVTLAAIALFRPGFRDEAEGQRRAAFLLDASASMGAVDGEEGQSRFDEARRRIGERIDTMTDTDSAMLVQFSDRAEVLQPFTSDRQRLRAALERARVSRRGSDLADALTLADGLAASPDRRTGFGANPDESSTDGSDAAGGTGETGETGETNATGESGENGGPIEDGGPGGSVPRADLHLFSDGGFPPATELNLAHLAPRYHAVGRSEVKNLAITAFSADRSLNRPGQVDVIATVANLGTTDASAPVVLSSGDDLLDASAVELEPGEQTGIAFTLEREDLDRFTLTVESDDPFPLDDRAFAVLSPPRVVNVLLVTPGNEPLEIGLTTERAAAICRVETVPPSSLETDPFAARSAAGTDDLIVFDRCRPPRMPRTNTFTIGELPHDGWSWDGEPTTPLVVDFDRTHPLLRYVELYSLLIFRGRALAGPEGFRSLVTADSGPLVAIGERDGYQDLVLGFEIITTGDSGGTQANTNWYAERTWPVFVLNVLRTLGGAAEATGGRSFRPGESVRLRVDATVDEVTIRRDGGEGWTLKREPGRGIEFTDTDQPGNYHVRSGERIVDAFSVNLFDRRESELATAPEVELGYESIAADVGSESRRREFWRWLLIGMLGLLVAEWWVYSRRVG